MRITAWLTDDQAADVYGQANCRVPEGPPYTVLFHGGPLDGTRGTFDHHPYGEIVLDNTDGRTRGRAGYYFLHMHDETPEVDYHWGGIIRR